MSKPRDPKKLLVGLDIGTSKIVCIVAEVTPEGTLDIIGMGSHPSRGLRRGVVVNIEATVNAIQRALEEAELMADCKIREVYTGIAGSHIKSFNSHGMFAIRDKEISQMDVDRVVETARAVNIPTDQQILHTIPQEFIVDGQEDVRDPLGMSAVRLEVKVHIVTGAVSAAQNIIKCVRRCGLEVSDLVLQPLASAMAVLTEDEKELGVCLVDIGGGTTDIAVFTNGAIRHTAVIPVAGDQVNNDIAVALRTPPKEAEDIKVRYGCALRQLADARDMIEVPGIGDRPPRTLSTTDLGRVHRAAHGRTVFAGAGGVAPHRFRGAAVVRHRHHRRLGGDAGHGRTRRGSVPHAGAPRLAALRRRPRRSHAQPALCYLHRPADGRAGRARARCAEAFRRQLQGDIRAHEGMVQGKFLTTRKRSRDGI
jgi:cell division protein FtsA